MARFGNREFVRGVLNSGARHSMGLEKLLRSPRRRYGRHGRVSSGSLTRWRDAPEGSGWSGCANLQLTANFGQRQSVYWPFARHFS